MKQIFRIKKRLALLLAFLTALSLAACTNNKIYLTLEGACLRTGESVRLWPKNMPEGIAPADCRWTLKNSSEGDVLRIDAEGNATALRPGRVLVDLEIPKRSGKTYLAWCTVEVLDSLTMTPEHVVRIQGDGAELTVTNERGVRPDTEVTWQIADPSIVSFIEYVKGVEHHKARICAEAAGETTVSASLGDVQAVCHVTVLAQDDAETYRVMLSQGEDGAVWRKLSTFFGEGGRLHEWAVPPAPAGLTDAYAYPIDLLLSLYRGQETKLENDKWLRFCSLGLLRADELPASLARLAPAAGLFRALYGDAPADDVLAMTDGAWQNAMTAAQYAALGTEEKSKALVLWTVEDAYRPYHEKNPTALTRALFDDESRAVADCTLTALLGEARIPARLEEVNCLLELRLSGVRDDTRYYYSDTGKLADDVTVVKTRVTCLVWQLVNGEWTQVYDAGYLEGDLPASDYYTTKLVVGDLPGDVQLWKLIGDALTHLNA